MTDLSHQPPALRAPSRDRPRPERAIIAHRRRRYAVGLHWSQGQADQLADDARSLAKQLHSDLFCIRGRPYADIGVGRTEQGHRHGMIAAATVAAANRPGSWAALVEVPEGIWYVAVHDNALIGPCDLLFANLVEAAQHLEAQRANHSWTTIYGPRAANISDAQTITLDEILGSARGQPLIALDAGRRRLFRAAAAISGVAILFGAWTYYSHYRAEQERQAFAARLAAQRTAGANLPPPWQTQPHPLAFAAACADAMNQLYRPNPGWEIEDLNCGSTAPRPVPGRPTLAGPAVASITWRRDFGHLVDLLAEYKSGLNLDPASTGQNDQLITYQLPLDLARAPRAAAPTQPIALARLDLLSFASTYHQTIGVRQPTSPPARRPQTNPNAPLPPPFYRAAAIQLDTLIAPEHWQPLLDTPGVVLTHIKFDPRQTKWHIEGTLYDRRPTP